MAVEEADGKKNKPVYKTGPESWSECLVLVHGFAILIDNPIPR